MRVAGIFQHRNVVNMQTRENLLVSSSSKQTLVLSKSRVHVIPCHVLEASGKTSDDVLVTCVFSLSYGSEFHLRRLIGWFASLSGELGLEVFQ